MIEQFFVWFFGPNATPLIEITLSITFLLVCFGLLTRWVTRP